MNSACSHLQDDWELYALGGLPEPEHAAMESHLEEGCKDCRQRYFEAQTALTAMSTLAPMLRPSPKVEQKLMRAIRAERAPATPAWPWWRPVPWAVAFACLLTMLWLAIDRRDLRRELAQSRQDAMAEQQRRQALQDEIQDRSEAAQIPPQSDAASPNAASNSPDVGKLRAELFEARRQAQVAQSDKVAWQHQFEQLRADLATATARSAALESDLRSAQLEARQAQAQARNLAAKNQELEKAQPARSDSDKTAMLAAELAKSQADVRRLSAAARDGERIERLLQSSSLQQISLRGLIPQAGNATARALYSPQGGLLLLADSLPRLPDQKCYQLWLIRKGSPAISSGGLITLQEDGKGILFAPPSNELAQVTALAITDEPAGGSVTSRGRKLLFGAQ
jgi:anti-sigma-K factor RskA